MQVFASSNPWHVLNRRIKKFLRDWAVLFYCFKNFFARFHELSKFAGFDVEIEYEWGVRVHRLKEVREAVDLVAALTGRNGRKLVERFQIIAVLDFIFQELEKMLRFCDGQDGFDVVRRPRHEVFSGREQIVADETQWFVLKIGILKVQYFFDDRKGIGAPEIFGNLKMMKREKYFDGSNWSVTSRF